MIPWAEGVADVDIEIVSRVGHRDLAGLRVILAHTSVLTFGFGRIKSATDEICQLAAEADAPCLVVLHHNLQPLPFFYFWPYGDSADVGRPLHSAAGPGQPAYGRSPPATPTATGFGAGRGSPTARSARTKDYPGVWASYEVFEGGLVQVNRRIEAPDCAEWLEYSRRCTGGAWGRWTPGRLDDRRFVARWDRPATA